MNTRFTVLTTVAVGLAIVPVAGQAFAEPRDSGPTLEPVETEHEDFVPTTLPPTFELDDDIAEGGPVVLHDAPETTPVTTMPAAQFGRGEPTDSGRTGERVGVEAEHPVRVDAVGGSESAAKLNIDPDLLPEPTYLAPCGVVPHNLDPQGPIVLADMTGDGTADDRLSIRQVGAGPTLGYRLHLELKDGTRSEHHIAAFDGFLPIIDDRVKLWQESLTDHPAPAADEVLVEFGQVGATRYWQLFGTDDRGCIARYTNEIGSSATVVLRDDASYKAGWFCNSLGYIKAEDATSNGDGTWDLRKWGLRRTGPTTVESNTLGRVFGLQGWALDLYTAGC